MKISLIFCNTFVIFVKVLYTLQIFSRIWFYSSVSIFIILIDRRILAEKMKFRPNDLEKFEVNFCSKYEMRKSFRNLFQSLDIHELKRLVSNSRQNLFSAKKALPYLNTKSSSELEDVLYSEKFDYLYNEFFSALYRNLSQVAKSKLNSTSFIHLDQYSDMSFNSPEMKLNLLPFLSSVSYFDEEELMINLAMDLTLDNDFINYHYVSRSYSIGNARICHQLNVGLKNKTELGKDW